MSLADLLLHLLENTTASLLSRDPGLCIWRTFRSIRTASLKDFMNSGSGLQGLKLPTGASQSDLPTSFDQQSKWMDFMKIAEGELSMAECSQILRNMELEDSENEDLISATEIEEEMVPVSDLKLKMEGRNLLNDFDDCKVNVETTDLPMSAVRDGVLAAEEFGKPKRKK